MKKVYDLGMIRLFFILICCLGSLLGAAGYFPPIQPHHSGMLQVDDEHQIYWEESGNPTGVPVIFLHGGPGSGTDPLQRSFFDPTFYRIILFDQRGCGKSLPCACLENNTTWDLVEDINKLRASLNIDKCVLFGGSWGSTLALAYAIKYPENVLGLILRGVFLCRQHELDWFYREGASKVSPVAWNIFIEPIAEENRGELISAYKEQLHAESEWTRKNAAAAWVLWEYANIQSKPDLRLKVLLNSKPLFYLFAALYAKQNQTFAKIENHYFLNRGFFETDNWIIENIHKIQNIPGIIVQGKCDQICPWNNAQELHAAWPASTFILAPLAGHSANEPEILEALIQATETFKERFSEHKYNSSAALRTVHP